MSAWPQYAGARRRRQDGRRHAAGLARGRPRAGAASRSVDPAPAPKSWRWRRSRGIALNPAPCEHRAPEMLVLAIKPQMLEAAAPRSRSSRARKRLVVSIIAGKTIANLAARLPHPRAFVRAMPNTPAAVGRGVDRGRRQRRRHARPARDRARSAFRRRASSNGCPTKR